MTIIERLMHLERDNARLRALLRLQERRFAGAELGYYAIRDDGGLDGPFDTVEAAAENTVADGVACTIVQAVAHCPEKDDTETAPENFGVRPGIDFPATLNRAMGY